MMPLDEHELTDHDLLWREDLLAAKEHGASSVRYGISWPRVHVAPDLFDWSELDERIDYAVDELGLTVVADLVHYGTPTWLEDSFDDSRYPQTIADFASAFAERFAGRVDHITPLNEPMTTASFCGLRGVWPPALVGWEGWTRIVLAIVDGIQLSVEAIRRANPHAVIVHVEAASLYSTDDASLADDVTELAQLSLLPTDLLVGTVDENHPMWGWLVDHGAEPGVLRRLRDRAVSPDILGLNYYPDLSPRHLYRADKAVRQRAINEWSSGLERCLETFWERYALPIVITETSIEGTDDVRRQWLEDSLLVVDKLRTHGIDIRGYTWWPFMDFVDWSYASGGRNVEEFDVDASLLEQRQQISDEGTEASASVPKTSYLRRMGILRLDENADGSLDRAETPVSARYSALASGMATDLRAIHA
ncbi:family 1 glycosylhydrolase [Cryobacterium sp. GrIS_2_6]|uniref:family 1 glycosylhydrolase n=1 Tax=Cryobacterium sp. GrIS_2_6 TaxID=3162785 RepID=UPI002E0997F8|nr:family 1 glycosylhydrolase [Cryobacterium psychrotolerans]MEC5148841.1 beta-glucosidase/6-phospho-beta-glucosidase/beta-galactosidase [Cryobacterium psychrotolerans]